MKKVYLSLLAVAVVGVFANCGKSSSSNNAPADMGATCAYQQNGSTGYNPYANNSMYGGYNTTPTPIPGGVCSYPYAAVAGFSQMQSNNFMSAGASSFGGTMACGSGQDAVYSPSKGLGCVSTNSIIINGQPAIYDFNGTAMSFVLVSAPNPAFLTYQTQAQTNPYATQQFPTYGGTYGGYNTGGVSSLIQTTNRQVLRVCDTTEVCPQGQSCRSPTGPQTAPAIGICYF